ncbi:MAG: hypothetical protein C0410_09410 [Anaerolinea sp.]|nr:hypothetical protein [Anaerolinea sp.]
MLAQTILVVEDERIVAKDIQNVLVKAGYEVPAIVSSGENALIKAKDCKPDLVLMDIILQGEMDGIDTAQQIRSLWGIPVIYLTAYGDDAIMERAKATEPIGYILKPYDAMELLTTIKIAFHQYKIARDREEENLRASEEKFRTLFQNLKDMVFISDVHSKTLPFQILEVNSAACDLLSYERDELLALSRVDLVSPEQREDSKKNLRRILHDGEMTFESSLVSKNGLIIPVEVHASSFKFNGRNVVLSIVRDITSRKILEMELNKVNRAMKTLSECNQTLVRTTDEKSLLESICKNIVEVGGYRLAWIGYAEQDRSKTVRQMAYAGFNEGYLESLAVTWADTPRGRGPTGTAIRTKKPVISNSILSDPKFTPWKKEALNRGYRSSIALPVFANKQIIGALNIYSQESDSFKAEETKLLTELASDLSFGITALRTNEQKMLAEETLREKEKRYHRTLDNMLEGCQIIGFDWRYIYVNDAVVNQGKKKREDLLGKTMMEVYPGIEKTEMFAALRRCMTERIDQKMENEFTFPDGSKGFFELSIQPELEGIFILSEDITKNKLAEQALKESEAKFLDLYENAPDMYITWDVKASHILVCNQTTVNNLGYSKDELIDQPILKLFNPDDLDYAQRVFNLINETGEGQDINLQLMRQDGSKQDVSLSSSAVRNEEGELLFIRSIWHDITERKHIENSLQISETRYRRLFESAKDGILILDADSGRIIDINPFLIELLGYPAEELFDKELWEIGLLKDIVKSKEMFLELQDKGYVRYEDIPLETKNGIRKDVEFVSNVYDVDRIKVIQCNIRDITERKRAENKGMVLQEIMKGLATAANLQDYLDLVHHAIGKVIFADNFFVILKDEKTGLFEEIYSIDKYDAPSLPSLLEKSISSYVFRTGSPLLLSKGRFEELVTLGEVELVGTDCASWLGVPLISAGKTIGVMTVQDYDNPDRYSESDKEFMASIAGQVAQIVERKQVQEKLSESEAELRALFASMTDVVIVYGSDGTNLRIAPTNPNSLVKPSGEMVGKKMHDILPKDQADFFVAKIQEAIQSGEIIQVEYSLLLNDKEVWFSANISKLSENTVVWTAHDITKRKISEEEIRLRSEDLQALYDLSRALTDLYDPDQIYEIACRTSVMNIHATFARIALLEGDELIIRSAFPIRVLDHDLFVGEQYSLNTLSFCRRVMEKNEPIILHTNDWHVCEAERKALLLDQSQSLCIIPFQLGEGGQAGGKSSGLLLLNEKREEKREPFTTAKIHLAKSICEQTAGAIQRATLNSQTEQQLKRLTSLRRIDMSISGSFDVQLILDILLEEVTIQLKVDAASIYLYKPNNHELELIATRGFGNRKGKHDHITLGVDYPGLAALENRSIFIEDLDQAEESSLLGQMLVSEGFVTYIAVPLMAKSEIRGVIEIAHRTRLTLSEDWLRFLEMLAGQGAIAIETTQLFTNLQRSNIELSMAYDATIRGWSNALDLRDQETEGHTQRVTEMTLKLAATFGFDEKEIINIKRGALLHDIGKMGIPDSILLKPGQLSDDEWVTMRKHPRIAYELISPITYLRPATDIPYCHHEKWDGTGYPRGLKGEQIPLAARLFAVVDVYDALTNERPYRHAWSKEKTLAYIQENSGTYFDPQIIPVFFHLLEIE